MTVNSMEIQQIMAHLPHRYPMLLIDRVLSVEPGKEDRGAEERDHQRTVLQWSLSPSSGDARVC